MKNKSRKPLHIIFLDFDDIKNPLLNAGQARATYEVGKLLIEKGHHVTVISSKYPGYKDRTEEGIYYHHIGFGTNNIRLNNIIYILSIPFAVRKLQGDIIVECFTGPISTMFSPLFTNIPVVGLPTSFEAERFSSLYHLPFHVIERFGSRFYKYFLPYTEETAEKMKRYNKKVIYKIVSQGVGKEYFSIKKKKGEYILYLGRLDISQKGLDLLVKAYAKVSDKIAYPLVIAGFGPDDKKVKEEIKKYGLEKKVTMIGPTYGEKKQQILSNALFVAFPSRHEGFSLFSLEALAAGLPLVGFAIPGLSWAKKDIAMKATPFDIDEYAHHLYRVTDPVLLNKMYDATKKFAKKFSWEQVTNEFESFFYQIVLK